jgi:iron complex transport system substrate-binding protein
MNYIKVYPVFFLMLFLLLGCKNENKENSQNTLSNAIEYAQGLSLFEYDNFTLLKVTQPWIGANRSFTYVLHKKGTQLPDSLSVYPLIQVPIQSVIVTSTTHLPSLDLLEEVNSLKGFPGLDYISSDKIRQQIKKGEIKELGQNESINTEAVLDIEPDVIVAFAMDEHNSPLKTLEQSGIPVIYNGDWTEQNPLGKAEWIKLFGALYGKEAQAKELFDNIVADYKSVLGLIENESDLPTVMSGVMYQDVWYLPQGESWMAVYLKDAKADYLWKDTKGTGSLALSFEAVFDKAREAEYWISPGHYETLKDLKGSNAHYAEFESFKTRKVYSFAPVKGETGGTLFYELGPMRPDWVLKDLVSIFHPELLPDYKPHFFQQLK